MIKGWGGYATRRKLGCTVVRVVGGEVVVVRLVDAGCAAVVKRVEVVGVALAAAVVELAARDARRVVVPAQLVGEARPDVHRQSTVGRRVQPANAATRRTH